MTLPDPEAAVDFKDTHFETPLSMSQFVFNQAAVFTSAIFDGYGWFDSATFSGEAWFGSASFGGDAWFGSARFSRYAWFDRAKFRGDARFSSATVSGDAVFNGATFGGDAWFDGAAFTGYAWFDSATFSGDAWLDSASFSGDAWFGNATFERFANFTGATFEKIASFSDCQFGRTTSFREARFQGTFPRFSGAILHQNTIFTAKDRFWPAMSSVEPEASRDSLAVIRHAIAKQGLPEEEHYFFRREMRFRAKIGTVFERLPYILYQELSDFGNSIVRPTVGLLVDGSDRKSPIGDSRSRWDVQVCRDAQRHFLHAFVPRPSAIASDRRGPQEPTEACLAGAYRALERGRARNLGHHGRDWQVQDLRVALAGALHE